MKTVIFFYSEAMKEVCWLRKDIIFFDEKGWHLLDGKSRNTVTPSNLILNNCNYRSYNSIAIIKKLREWLPIWSRWCGKGDQYELLIREALFLVIEIAEGLKKLNIKNCIMHTSIPHHIDSVIFHLACEQQNLRIIYLYSENISGRLIPIDMSSSVTNRKLFGKLISNYNYKEILIKFLKNNKKGMQPKNNFISSNNESFLFALILIIKLSLRNLVKLSVKSILKFIFNRSHYKNSENIFIKFNNSYFLQNINHIFQQREALTFLDRNIIGQSYLEKNLLKKTRPLLLLAAHLQPEATSFPEGWDFANHIDILLKLRELGYKEIILYKEHWASYLYSINHYAGTVKNKKNYQMTKVAINRSKAYFEQLKKIGCIFMPNNFSISISNPLIKTFMPVTISGTVALERSLNGLHTIYTGTPWWKNLPGTIQLSEIKSLSTLRSEWVTPDPILARKAFKFLEKSLNNKSIINLPGIGTNFNLNGAKDKALWKNEIESLLKKINKRVL